MSGVQARCSHCAYVRRFSPELGGRYFRCPRCKQGVLAVPRPSAEEAEAWESTHGAWLEQSARALASAGGPTGAPGSGSGSRAGAAGSGSSAGEAAQAALRPRRATPTDDAGDDELSESDIDDGELEGSEIDESELEESEPDARPGSPDEAPAPFPFGGAGRGSGGKPGNLVSRRGEVAAARQLLVECGLCGFLVKIPPEFFGKTVHCPECAGATVFSESTLEPVKDELLDRLMLETRERELLFPPAETGRSRRQATRWVLLGVGLGALIPGAILGVSALDRHLARSSKVSEAEQEGWRYGLDTGALLVHEPWCAQLHHADKHIPAGELDQCLAQGYSLHDCR